MKIARFVSFTLAVAAMALHVGAAQAAMKTQWIDYKQGNAPLSGYLVYDDAVQGRRPGVLMIHDRAGFAAKTLADAEMISKLGYVVLAEDIYGKGVVPKTVPEMTEQTEIYEKDLPLMRARALAGLDVLKPQPMGDPAEVATASGKVSSVVSQLGAGKVNFEVNLYSGAGHGFTNPQNPSEVRADEEYKVAMARFLKDLLAH